MCAAAQWSGTLRVTRADEVLVEAAAGFADADAGNPCTQTTRYQAASVSKQVVATAVMMLVEHQELALADPITRWFPALPAHWQDITVHELLSHTSGLGHWKDIPGFAIGQPPPRVELLERLAAVPLLAPSGSRWSYSGPGFLIAAGIIERIVDTTYASFVTEKIFGPAGMTATTSGQFPSHDMGARGYCNGCPMADLPDLADFPGTGDMWTTATDLNHYTAALQHGLLTAESLAAMYTSHAPVGVAGPNQGFIVESGYGYGSFLGRVHGADARFHPGDNPGYQSLHAWLPEADISLAILSNDEGTNLTNVLKPFTAKILG